MVCGVNNGAIGKQSHSALPWSLLGSKYGTGIVWNMGQGSWWFTALKVVSVYWQVTCTLQWRHMSAMTGGFPSQRANDTKSFSMSLRHNSLVQRRPHCCQMLYHDDVITWKHFPRYWPFVWGIHRSPVNSPHKGQWRGALMFSFICTWINGWVNNREAGDLRRHRAHYHVTVMATCAHQGWTKTTLSLWHRQLNTSIWNCRVQ